MRRKKKNGILNRTDVRLAARYPTANSAEFIPLAEPDFKEFEPENSLEVYDFIPELKGDKFN